MPVQIPLWTMETDLLLENRLELLRSDSSMDDGNAVITEDGDIEISVQIPLWTMETFCYHAGRVTRGFRFSMDDGNTLTRCLSRVPATFRFLYGRWKPGSRPAGARASETFRFSMDDGNPNIALFAF